MPTTAKTGTKQVKSAPSPDTVDQSGFLPRRKDADGNTVELHGKTWEKVED